MATNLPSRQQVERAQPLEFAQPAERQANITIEVAPDGLHITAEYTGTLASIPAAVERLRAAGVLDLVKPSAAPAFHQGRNSPMGNTPRAQRVAPAYADDGSVICPVHRKALSYGQYGPYCSCKATGDQVADKRGYCGLRFES